MTRIFSAAVIALALSVTAAHAKVIGGRPPGCPHAFCGCGASLKVFGRIIPDLNLAENWVRRFARSAPAPGMAAARRGHVFVLLRHRRGRTWFVYDANSGGGKTRIHERSLAGFTVVNPHSRRMAGMFPLALNSLGLTER